MRGRARARGDVLSLNHLEEVVVVIVRAREEAAAVVVRGRARARRAWSAEEEGMGGGMASNRCVLSAEKEVTNTGDGGRWARELGALLG